MLLGRIFTHFSAAGLVALTGLAGWFLSDELRTQSLRRTPIEDLILPEHAPEQASADYLDALATRALEAPVNSTDLAIAATNLSIEKEPRRTSNWNRLAYIDILQHGTLTDAGIEALRQSLFLSPYGELENMRWRLQLANAYWDTLPEELKTQSSAQITALSVRGSDRRWLNSFAETAHPEIAERIAQNIETTG